MATVTVLNFVGKPIGVANYRPTRYPRGKIGYLYWLLYRSSESNDLTKAKYFEMTLRIF